MVELNEEELARQTVSEQVDNLNTDETYKLQDLIDQHGAGLELYVETDWDYGDCMITMRLSTTRLETDEEYEARIVKLKAYKKKQAIAAEKRRAAALARKLKKETDERKLYELLKTKFEKE